MFSHPFPGGRQPGPRRGFRGPHHHPHEGGPGGFGPGPGFGPGGPGFGPGGPEFGPGGRGFGPGGRGLGPGGRRHGRGRAPRGDVRTAVLLLLAEQPMHGYQLMQAIAERSGGRWTPSPGAVYPTISALEDEGLATVTAEAGRKLVTLTEAGRQHVEERRDTWADPFGGTADGAAGPDLRGLLEQVHGAVRQVSRTGSEAQLTAAAAVLAEARRALYLLLAEGPDAGTPGQTGTPGQAGTPAT
ncbi:Transcriptional regulator PadR-like family protein [Geodermatophilus telluris]|uniref:Transcriptional regulator PadR-like family protein n=1 Tax=Geodermatophilus telluris TaxID=1190417 RepID=A0A1G6T580_9ACTN|nr:PadR family transcriptional regulator [Geodermatophilus telluris]SDD24189.1 Transcriptional regulator PadR-like family protein [Geodermatophilus telluris]